jgi:hypothetical protein
MSQSAVKDEKSVASPSSAFLKEWGLGNDVKPKADETTQAENIPETKETTPVKAVVSTDKAELDTKPAKEAKADKADDKKAEPDEFAKLNKQLKDTRDAFTQERQTNKTLLQKQQALESKLDILTKKIDGTYDESKDGIKLPQPHDIQQSERVATSHWAAVDKYGEKYVMDTIWAEDAPFRKFDTDPAIQARVMSSRTPILEAIKVVKEAEAKAKYGDDPETMRKTIADELRDTLTKEIRQQLLKEMGRQPVEEVKGLANVRQASADKTEEPERLNFNSLFPGFAK